MSRRPEKSVWSDKCYCTGVHVSPIVEMLNASPAMARPASPVQATEQPSPTFQESLLRASKPSSDAGSVHEGTPRTARRESAASDDERPPHSTLHSAVVSLPAPTQPALQQVPSAQGMPVIDSVPVVPPQPPPAGTVESERTVTVAVSPTRDSVGPQFPSSGLSIVQAAAGKPDGLPSIGIQGQSDSPVTAPMLPRVENASQTATNLLQEVTRANANSLVAVDPSPASKTSASVVDGANPGVVAGAIQNGVPALIQSPVQNVPPAAQDAVQSAVHGAGESKFTLGSRF